MPFSNYMDSGSTNHSLWGDWKFEFEDGSLNAGSLLANEAIKDDQLVISYVNDDNYYHS